MEAIATAEISATGGGIFRQVCTVLGDDHAVQERDSPRCAAPGTHLMVPVRPSGLADWERLGLCEQMMLAVEASRGDCIVWLRLAQHRCLKWEVRHGPVTFYNASVLAGYIAFHTTLPGRRWG